MRETKNDWRETIQRLRLFDDVMMTKCLDDIAVAQHVLRVILRRPLVVKSVKAQETDESAAWRGVRFDILAIDENGRLCDIEVQRRDTGDLAKRASFYSAALVKEALEKGEGFDSLRETFVIFITETDVFKNGKAEYNFERFCKETGEPLGDGARIVFVNGEYAGRDDIGDLVHDMKQADPDKMRTKILSDRLRLFKESDREENEMSEILEEIFEKGRSEGVAEQKAESAKKLSRQKAESDMALAQMGNSLSQMTNSLSQRDADNARMKDEIARLMAENAALKKAARL